MPIPSSPVYPIGPDAFSPLEVRWRDVFPTQTLATLPRHASVWEWAPPIQNQRQRNSCSAASGSSVYDTLWKKAHPKGPAFLGSRDMLYTAEEVIQGTPHADQGAQLRTTQQALLEYGVCAQAADPNDPQDFLRALTPALLTEASAHKILRGLWAPTLEEILSAIAAGYPVQIGVRVYPQWESAQAAQTGQIADPVGGEQTLGGHALMLGGYSLPATPTALPDQCLCEAANSWGADWGDHGHLFLSGSYLASPATFLSARVYLLA